jgi:tetratricopeptide (TPR) repeat protein
MVAVSAAHARPAPCTWRKRPIRTGPADAVSEGAPILSVQALREDGNQAFRIKDFSKAAGLYTAALEQATDMEERGGLLTNRANAHYSLGSYAQSRDDALEALRCAPGHVKALFRVAMAEERLGHPVAALAALAAGAMHAEPTSPYFATFTKQARQLGAWRLPPPLSGIPPPTEDALVPSLSAASREAFVPFTERGEPVIVRGFADVSGWSWDGLIALARSSERAGRAISGEVLVSATGCVPDYKRDASDPHASRLEAMTTRRVGLTELFERVSAAARSQPGGRKEHAPLLCEFEKVYSYGKAWMLHNDDLYRKARMAWPTFLKESDLAQSDEQTGGAGAGVPASTAANAANAKVGLGSSVCWVGSEGCLTPLHYDCSDGLLAQVLGKKRVWLFPPDDMDNVYLRSTRRPGVDNWERQSMATLHGAPAEEWPHLRKARRWVADLQPGDLLYIPSDWLHEVHSLTPSFSLGWRVAMVSGGGQRTERTASQKLERMASAVKSGNMSIEESLSQALSDPTMLSMMGSMLGGAGGVEGLNLPGMLPSGGGAAGLAGLGNLAHLLPGGMPGALPKPNAR